MTLLDIETNGHGSRVGRAGLCRFNQVNGAHRDADRQYRDSCLDLLRSLTQEEWATLADFARGRMLRVGLDPSQAQDMVQDAVLAVLKGMESAGEGRHPRNADLTDGEAFLDYLRGVIASLVESGRRNGWNGRVWETFDDISTACQLPQAGDFAQLEFRDLRRQFFAALAGQVPDRLRWLVRAWRDRGEDCEQIPLLGGHRRWRAELRKMAAQVLKRLLEPAPLPQIRKKGNYDQTRR